MIDIENAKKIFKEYVSGYNIEDGKILLKYNHILRVAEICKNVAKSLNLSDEDVKLAELIGIFHDIGRFEQIKVYNTFVDRDSINHGEYGVKVLFDDNLIEKFNIDEKYYHTIKCAVLNHNRTAIITDGLTENEILHCKIIRDSDKLDIFHVLLTEDTIDSYGIESLEDETFSDEIVREFKEDHHIDYGKRKTFGDKWIAHMTYVYDFNFKSSYEVMKEKDYINKMLKMPNFRRAETIDRANEIARIAEKYINSQI